MHETSSMWRELIEVLDSLIGGHITGIDASRRVSQLRAMLNEEENPLFFPLVANDSETDHLPMGGVRDHYSKRGLSKADAEISRFETSARDDLVRAAEALRRYASEHAI